MDVKDSELIEFVYQLAVEGIEEDWFEDFESSEWYEYILSLPAKLQTTYLIGILNMQVRNGGFSQYFVNGYGQFVFETIEKLKVINANGVAKLLIEAVTKINCDDLSPENFRKAIRSQAIDSLYDSDDLDDFLEDLDSQYYNLSDDLEKSLSDFLRA